MTCPECHGSTIYPSAVPGMVACGFCGLLFLGEAEADESVEAESLILPDGEVRIPDEVGVHYGWRAWDVKADAVELGQVPLLRSATASAYAWTPRQINYAICTKGTGRKNGQTAGKPHEVPAPGCRCGLHAAKDLDHLISLGYQDYDEEKGSWSVIGRVALWGRVIEGTQGWRAEKGYPDQLYVPYEAANLIEPLEETYGVEVGVGNWLGESYE